MVITKSYLSLPHINKLNNMGHEKNRLKYDVNFNQEHWESVKAARNMESRITFKAKEQDKIGFNLICKKNALNPSLVLRELMIRFTDKNTKK